MSPKEAGQYVIEEPNWREVFEKHKRRWPRLPDYLACDSAYEATLHDWRKFHFTEVEVKGEPKRQLADASTAMIALVALGIMPPRGLIKDVPRDGALFQEQHDNHCWLIMSQRAWRILAIEDRIMVLDSFGEQTQVDLATAKWGKYLEKAVEALQQQKEAPEKRHVKPGPL